MTSHPAGVRGLKHPRHSTALRSLIVAPRRGAWIETLEPQSWNPACQVAPRRGAWIETSSAATLAARASKSHPAGVRGLKHKIRYTHVPNEGSHPAGVRGLKRPQSRQSSRPACVAPRRGAWIETPGKRGGGNRTQVAPRRGAWIETLGTSSPNTAKVSRTPQGCVD